MKRKRKKELIEPFNITEMFNDNQAKEKTNFYTPSLMNQQ